MQLWAKRFPFNSRLAWKNQVCVFIILFIQFLKNISIAQSLHWIVTSFKKEQCVIFNKSCRRDTVGLSTVPSTRSNIFLMAEVVLYSNVPFNRRPKSIFMASSHTNPCACGCTRPPPLGGAVRVVHCPAVEIVKQHNTFIRTIVNCNTISPYRLKHRSQWAVHTRRGVTWYQTSQEQFALRQPQQDGSVTQ